jgi:hypothetical protein
MAITEAYTGTATVGTTELSLVSGTTTLQSVATPAVIQVFIDTVNMAAGDEYEIDIKDKVISGGTQRSLYLATLDGKQSGPFVTASLIMYHGWDVTMTKVTGTDRSFSWSIRKVG